MKWLRIGLLACAVCYLCQGCATVKLEEKFPSYFQHRKLDKAVSLIGKGDVQAGMTSLEEICSDPPVEGVTDEALFRLALLSLGHEGERERKFTAPKLLDRLQREFPASPWTAHAQPLMKYLGTNQDTRKLVRSLREQNANLNQEIRELRTAIDQLKKLDMQLDRKRLP